MSRDNILQGLKQDLRLDGRKALDYREISVETGISRNAEGSARIKIGETEVLVGVKMGVQTPYPDTPDEGVLSVNAELLPLSSPDFETGPPGIYAIELSRVVDRGIREAKSIDVKKLCIEKGEKVWSVMIDICPINDAGNLFDAASLGALVALKHCRFPSYDGIEIDYKTRTDKKLPMLAEPLGITVIKIGDNFIVDPISDEQKHIDARLMVTSTPEGRICALQKGGDHAFSIEEIEKMLDIGLEKAKELRAKIPE